MVSEGQLEGVLEVGESGREVEGRQLVEHEEVRRAASSLD